MMNIYIKIGLILLLVGLVTPIAGFSLPSPLVITPTAVTVTANPQATTKNNPVTISVIVQSAEKVSGTCYIYVNNAFFTSTSGVAGADGSWYFSTVITPAVDGVYSVRVAYYEAADPINPAEGYSSFTVGNPNPSTSPTPQPSGIMEPQSRVFASGMFNYATIAGAFMVLAGFIIMKRKGRKNSG